MGIEVQVEDRSWWGKHFGKGFRRKLTLAGGDFENWFIPLFHPLYEKTGKRIDIYGWEAFSGPELEQIARILRQARSDVSKGGPKVQINISISAPVGTPYHSEISQELVLGELDQLNTIIETALAEKKTVRFVGD